MDISVLHVDDCESVLELTKYYLKAYDRHKFCVDSVETPECFMSLAFFRRYDIYLVDYRLFPADGLELLKGLREKDNNTPFILLTGRFESNCIKQKLFEYGGRYIQKKLDYKLSMKVLIRNILEMVL